MVILFFNLKNKIIIKISSLFMNSIGLTVDSVTFCRIFFTIDIVTNVTWWGFLKLSSCSFQIKLEKNGMFWMKWDQNSRHFFKLFFIGLTLRRIHVYSPIYIRFWFDNKLFIGFSYRLLYVFDMRWFYVCLDHNVTDRTAEKQ